jgi:hypothetical protein
VGAVAIGLGSVDVPMPATVALVGMTWKFTKPVHVGDSVAARWRLNRKRDVENPQWGLVTWQVEVVGGDGEVKALGEVSRLVARREAMAVDGDVDQPAAKRRRRRRSSSTGSAPAPAPDTPEPAPADTPPPSRRRRRGRRGGGGGNGHANGGDGGAPPAEMAAHDPAPAAPDSGIPAERHLAPAATAEQVQTPAGGGEDSGPGIGGVLKRIRRRRT